MGEWANRRITHHASRITHHASRITFHVAVAAMLSAQRTFESHQALLDYLGEYLQMPITFKQRRTYEEVNVLLERGQLELAFICTGAYIALKERAPVEIMGVPVIDGKKTYQSYIIVPADSPIQDIAELREKRFAFTDPLSNTGKLYTTYLLAQIGTTPDAFFASFTYTNSHDNSIQAVAQHNVGGASVDSLVYDQLARDAPHLIDWTLDKRGSVNSSKSDPYAHRVVIHRRVDRLHGFAWRKSHIRAPGD